jgi:hypothetical protein
VFALGAVLEPLLERFVSDDESEPLRFSRFLRPLQIEAVERYAVRDGLCAAFFKCEEVELIVHAPVVGDGVAGAIVEHELRAPRSLNNLFPAFMLTIQGCLA